jgi:hypothetical protein
MIRKTISLIVLICFINISLSFSEERHGPAATIGIDDPMPKSNKKSVIQQVDTIKKYTEIKKDTIPTYYYKLEKGISRQETEVTNSNKDLFVNERNKSSLSVGDFISYILLPVGIVIGIIVLVKKIDSSSSD